MACSMANKLLEKAKRNASQRQQAASGTTATPIIVSDDRGGASSSMSEDTASTRQQLNSLAAVKANIDSIKADASSHGFPASPRLTDHPSSDCNCKIAEHLLFQPPRLPLTEQGRSNLSPQQATVEDIVGIVDYFRPLLTSCSANDACASSTTFRCGFVRGPAPAWICCLVKVLSPCKQFEAALMHCLNRQQDDAIGWHVFVGLLASELHVVPETSPPGPLQAVLTHLKRSLGTQPFAHSRMLAAWLCRLGMHRLSFTQKWQREMQQEMEGLLMANLSFMQTPPTDSVVESLRSASSAWKLRLGSSPSE